MARQVEVLIWVNRSHRIIVRPERVALRERAGDEVLWRCLDGEAVIAFKKDSPFEAGRFHVSRGGGAVSGSPRPGSQRGPAYEDAVEVTLPDLSPSQQPVPRDPEIRVDP